MPSFLDFDVPWAYLNVGNIFFFITSSGLLFSMLKSKSSAGVSGKTQCLFLLAFSLRLLMAIFFRPEPDYDTQISTFTVIVLALSASRVYLSYIDTYDIEWDTFPVWHMLPVLCLMSAVAHQWSTRPYLIEVTFALSHYVEMLAFVPQFHMSYRMRRVHPVMVCYVVGLVYYQVSYLGYYIYTYRWIGRDPVASVTCLIQLLTYCAFFLFLRVKTDGTPENLTEKDEKSQSPTDDGSSQPGHGVIWIVGSSESSGANMVQEMYLITKRECHGLFGDSTEKRNPDSNCDSDNSLTTSGDTEETGKVSAKCPEGTEKPPVTSIPPDACSVAVDPPEKTTR